MFTRSRFVGAIVLLLALSPLAATVASGTEQSYKFTSPSGTLEWTVTTTSGTCGPDGSYSYTMWTFSGFTYVDAWGNDYPLNAIGPTYYAESTSSTYCIPTGPSGTDVPLDDSTAEVAAFTPEAGNGDPTAVSLPVPGYVNPKYAVVDVIYAPPGTTSSVTYTNDTVVGNATSTSVSFTSSNSVSSSLTASAGLGIPGFTDTVTTTDSNEYTQGESSSSSVATSQKVSYGITVYGCTTGLSHACDYMNVWLNPIVQFGVVPNSNVANWFGYGFDENDPAKEIHTILIQLGAIQCSPVTGCITSGTQTQIDRTWALDNMDGSGPALTSTDLDNVAAADPFSNASYTPVLGSDYTTTDGRFTQCHVTGCNTTISYVPDVAYTYTQGYSTTSTSSETATYSYSETFSEESNIKGSEFGDTFGADLKSSTSLTWTNMFSEATNSSSGHTASFTIGPAPSGYNGPDDFEVFQDNLYGTFMFLPVN